MSSYCDIEKLKIDATNHPNLTNRLVNWESTNDCRPYDKNNNPYQNNTTCLTDDEKACYSSYKIGTTRKKVDAALENIYQPNTSINASFDSNYNTTMLTGVLWAALGTTVLYYAFVKM